MSKMDNLGKTDLSNPRQNSENEIERPPQSKTNHTPSSSSGLEKIKLSTQPTQLSNPLTSKIDVEINLASSKELRL